ncbi:MAG TPA: dipeptide/oligopeptide/nickel ABC transporter ATP-binding protein, partial [Longimicrobiales bacterium]|nr:dipeptide/oligopeptide/nickel ABC transporter ATP-binding protein [Longimicrobiales bacterium]
TPLSQSRAQVRRAARGQGNAGARRVGTLLVPARGGQLMPLLEVTGLRVVFARRGAPDVVAVDGVSFSLERGRTVGVVGESGAGKSTLGRAVLRLVPTSGGALRFGGDDVLALDRTSLRRFRHRAQMVFQDPLGSLNPRMTAGDALEEALRVYGAPRYEVAGRAHELLERVGLHRGVLSAFPHQLSGGQRQRVGIARALAVEPDLLVLDEPVSALDVSVQAQIVNLLLRLQEELALSYLFISHDVALVHRVSDHILVMREGGVVDEGAPDVVVLQSGHPYTRTLVSASLLGAGGGAREAPKR